MNKRSLLSDMKDLFSMPRLTTISVCAFALCVMLSANPSMADSMTTGTIGTSTTYYFGFNREASDGTWMDGASQSGATTVPVAGSYSEMSRMDFLADPALAGLASGNEDFESFAFAGPSYGYNTPVPLTFGTTGVTGTLTPNGGELRRLATGTGHFAGRYPTSGDQYVDTSAEGSSSEMTVTFSEPVAGFGFYATDSGDFDGQLMLRITQVDGMGTSVVDFTLPSPTSSIPDGGINRYINPDPAPGEQYNASLLFFGLIDVLKPITAVTFVNVPDGVYNGGETGPGVVYDDDNYGFDDLIAVSSSSIVAVPEPASFGLLLLGSAALLGYSRRRTRSRAA